MTTKYRTIFVLDTEYRVTEHGNLMKAYMNGRYGWTTVWADTEANLIRRVKQARLGGQ